MTTKRVAQAALFVSLMIVTGVLIGICGAFWAQQYATDRVKASARLQRRYANNTIIYDGHAGKKTK